MKLASVLGARPQFIKVAPLLRALKDNPFTHILVHTGQHYDYEMSRLFFEELGLPEPEHHLGVGSGSHGEQTGEMLKRLEPVLLEERPDWVLVFGDTNSTLAGALAAAKLHIPVAHVEAGLRSYNRRMPEELNRIVVDHLSSLLCCPTRAAVANLKAEGFHRVWEQEGYLETGAGESSEIFGKGGLATPLVALTGDIMFDAYLLGQEVASRKSRILAELRLRPGEYYLVTVHRAENTDHPKNLGNLVQAFQELSRHLPVVWPLHPRTRKALENWGLASRMENHPLLRVLPPVGYFDMLLLEREARAILTDSGGIQKEAFFAGTPCLTLREETEWVETLEAGANRLVGTEPEAIVTAALELDSPRVRGAPYGDGQASRKILRLLEILAFAGREGH